ncbi:MAG: HupE/UreJ family protein [Pseudomonadota bacterium]
MSLVAFSALLSSAATHADIFRPAYLEVQELDADRYQVIWRVPTTGIRGLNAQPRFPEGSEVRGQPVETFAGGMYQRRYELQVPGGLSGKEIAFEGVLGTATDIIVRFRLESGDEQVEQLSPSEAHFTVSGTPSLIDVVSSYLILGFEHILGGIDHLLFVLCLMLLVRSLARLVVTITAFTVAHSITLAAASLDVLQVPGPPVEAVIALSIMFVAAEVVRETRGQQSLTTRSPWIAAFAFGLLHGFGFAGALAEIGLPSTAIPLALLMFNVGVELGQLAFVVVLLAAYYVVSSWSWVRSPQFRSALGYVIGSIAAFWTIERIASFLP